MRESCRRTRRCRRSGNSASCNNWASASPYFCVCGERSLAWMTSGPSRSLVRVHSERYVRVLRAFELSVHRVVRALGPCGAEGRHREDLCHEDPPEGRDVEKGPGMSPSDSMLYHHLHRTFSSSRTYAPNVMFSRSPTRHGSCNSTTPSKIRRTSTSSWSFCQEEI